jgi:3-oxoacyl-[acyl-carrier-protein] synthase III
MTKNANFSFDDVAIVSLEACEAPIVISSASVDERLAPFYERTDGKPGLLETLAGIRERRQWPDDVSFTDAAALAGEKAIVASGIDRSKIGLLIDTSVCRARLEPSSAVTVHDALGLETTCLNFDLVNACLGFVNAMHLAGIMIDAGQIDYALIVDGEGTREIYDNTINHLNQNGEGLADIIANFASLTLGSGSAAAVLGRHSDNPGSHQVLRGFFHAATQHHELCVGSLERMTTDTRGLLDAGTELAKLAWDDAGAGDTWGGRDRYIFHQVSEVHTNAMLDVLGIDADRVPKTFPFYGNIGPAAIPITLASVADTLSPGDSVLCLGIGSGLNAGVIELRW